MTAKIYHNSRCSKSRDTLKLLEANGVQPEIIEYLKQPPSAEELKDILRKLGITARELMRTKEPEYRDNILDDVALSEEQLIAAMVKIPKLIERPIVVIDDKAAVGRPPENVLKIL